MALSVKNGVKRLNNHVTVDKIESLSRETSNVVDGKVFVSVFATDELVERAGPGLRIRSKIERPVADGQEKSDVGMQPVIQRRFVAKSRTASVVRQQRVRDHS